jgi:hypothetical protein
MEINIEIGCIHVLSIVIPMFIYRGRVKREYGRWNGT